MKITVAPELESDQSFTVDDFRPEDALGVSQAFLAVYGPSYAMDNYYDPDWVREANGRGELHSVVARTPKGDIVAHGALYRSSPPNPRLLEYGQLLVRTNYRRTLAAYKIHQHLLKIVIPRLPLDGVFGEVVTNRPETQKLMDLAGYSPMALELDLMPAEAYLQEASATGRVTCVTAFRAYGDAPQVLHVPRWYLETLEFILADANLDRKLRVVDAPSVPSSPTRMEGRSFPSAGVSRVNVFLPGRDFPEALGTWERAARAQGVGVHQVFLPLDRPESVWAVECLKGQGYSLGGLMPWWFGPDALLMAKLDAATDYEAILLHSPKSRALLERIRAHREG